MNGILEVYNAAIIRTEHQALPGSNNDLNAGDEKENINGLFFNLFLAFPPAPADKTNNCKRSCHKINDGRV